ncbi:CYTOCHROME P450 83B1 [Salix koriyanagi]|uniref:CYTOCHROME P450 83B1 n=1 Tax=Salix koriyanagi TaxID=2511006 RepID=A0A9Q0VCP8_9ROSI|nr:CYTOCHROME P450 83B1 [Salix koriyanagi]
MAKQILKTHDLEFCTGPVFTGQQKLSYNGLDLAFSRYDAYWREMRKICLWILSPGNKGYVNENVVEQLSYLKAVVKETMRLQPTAPLLIPRETTKCKIDGYEIPAKTLVYVNAWVVGRDSEAWENPNEFNPDRFLGSSIDFKGQDFELIPFGSGRRICPGLDMGIATVELSLANLLHKFDWEMPAGMRREDIDIDHVLPGITTHRRDPLCLMPKPYAVMGNSE